MKNIIVFVVFIVKVLICTIVYLFTYWGLNKIGGVSNENMLAAFNGFTYFIDGIIIMYLVDSTLEISANTDNDEVK